MDGQTKVWTHRPTDVAPLALFIEMALIHAKTSNCNDWLSREPLNSLTQALLEINRGLPS